ncbi:Uncharacterised protein [Vibrio cholerae]|uniref:Uncharacterized protein n=1 Tax=Vibrio cholerae TaxID=666 RepID=A0A655XAA4_VIBCL|nr:Uncharacterised protein [Vibrio cholerae]
MHATVFLAAKEFCLAVKSIARFSGRLFQATVVQTTSVRCKGLIQSSTQLRKFEATLRRIEHQ